MAIGVGYGGVDTLKAHTLATGIAHGHCNTAACALVIGFIVMMVLDTALT